MDNPIHAMAQQATDIMLYIPDDKASLMTSITFSLKKIIEICVIQHNDNIWQLFPHIGIMVSLSFLIPTRKGGDSMVILLISFLYSIVASVISYYICKWLDGE